MFDQLSLQKVWVFAKMTAKYIITTALFLS